MMNTDRTLIDPAVSARSLQSVSLTAVLATISHAYEFGPVAFAAGAVGVALLWSLVAYYRRTGRRVALIPYGLLTLWVFVGFGLIGGFWNHTLKAAVVALHSGALPSELAGMFMSPDLGSVTAESIGVLTFFASLMAAYYGYRFARAVTAK